MTKKQIIATCNIIVGSLSAVTLTLCVEREMWPYAIANGF